MCFSNKGADKQRRTMMGPHNKQKQAARKPNRVMDPKDVTPGHGTLLEGHIQCDSLHTAFQKDKTGEQAGERFPGGQCGGRVSPSRDSEREFCHLIRCGHMNLTLLLTELHTPPVNFTVH